MAVNVHVIFYSTYGHVFQLAQAVAEGARQVPGANVGLYQVLETLTPDVLEKMGARQPRDHFAHIPVATPEQLPQADLIFFGTPTRYANVSGQMQGFFDRMGKLWATGALIGKVGAAFTSTATQHGGQEGTLRNLHTEMLHHGMVIVGIPYSCPGLSVISEVTGGTPYGASTIAGPKGDRQPTANELDVARFQGRHATQIAAALKAGAAAAAPAGVGAT